MWEPHINDNLPIRRLEGIPCQDTSANSVILS